jgi:tetratricopeptide (TPR) repeat protein
MALRGVAVWCLSLWLCSFAVLPARGAAQVVSSDDERGRTHFEAGASYYELGRYAEAAHEFQEAFELSGRPEMLINVWRAHERAGQMHEAVLALRLMLERFPQSNYRPEAEATLARLAPLDAESAPEAPEPEAPEPEAPEPEVPVLPAPELTPAPLPVQTAKTTERAVWPPSTYTLVLGSTAVVTGVLSLALGVRAHNIHDGLEQRCEGGLCAPDERHELEHGQRLARTSTGLSFAALALGAASAVLWVFDVKRERASTRLALGIERGGLAAHVRWEL